MRKSLKLIFIGVIMYTLMEYIYYLYALTQRMYVVNNGRLAPVGNPGNKTFHVNYGHPLVSLTNSDSVLKLNGIERLGNKTASPFLEDEHFDSTNLPFVNVFKDSSRTVRDINCYKLFIGDKNETAKAKALMKKEPSLQEQISAEEYINITKDCQRFKINRGYILSHLTKVERDFPIAYSIIVFKDVWQFERLLRAIYRPQNFYCIHVDIKTDQVIFRAFKNIAQCFDNVFLALKRFDVQWSTMTVLQAELSCMQELWTRSSTWKYFINLTGQEFPLRTNYELVQILKAYNGSNDVEGSGRKYSNRWVNAGTPPHGLTPTKGNHHVAVCRAFVDFALHDPRAKALLKWVGNRTYIPDEIFFSTLNHNPSLNISGSYKGAPITDPVKKPYVARFINWSYTGIPCKGMYVRRVCIFGMEDLPTLFSRKELFTNKFYWNYQHFALDCMEELLYNNTRDEYFGKLDFDVSWYAKLGFVTHKVN